MLLEEESAGKPGNNQLQQPNGSVPGQQIIPDSKSQKGNHHLKKWPLKWYKTGLIYYLVHDIPDFHVL